MSAVLGRHGGGELASRLCRRAERSRCRLIERLSDRSWGGSVREMRVV